MKRCLCFAAWVAACTVPAVALAGPAGATAAGAGVWNLQMDTGSLALLGAGLVILAVSKSFKQRP